MMDMIAKLNDIADRIYKHLEAGGGILDASDHDDMMQTIEFGADLARDFEDDDLLQALQRARDAMRAWNKEEYPYLEDVLSDMVPDGFDDGSEFYDED